MTIWQKEVEVDNFIAQNLEKLGLVRGRDFLVQDSKPYLKEALKGAAKTDNSKSTGVPDITLEIYKNSIGREIPVLFENKLGRINLANATNPSELSFLKADITKYALNGALHYARHIIKSGKYEEAIAIGAAGSSEKDLAFRVFYVYTDGEFKEILSDEKPFSNFAFLQDADAFAEFYENILLDDESKHKILLQKRAVISKHAKNLSKIMNDFSILPHERALFVAACLLAQQSINDSADNPVIKGLTTDDLHGSDDERFRDSLVINAQVEKFLQYRNLKPDKIALMLNAFHRMTTNKNRDKPRALHKLAKTLIKSDASANKQIFAYIYENIFKEIHTLNKNLKFYDVMGEMYGEFLKYALSGGQQVGIVLTPPYVTKMMAQILEIDENSRVMDLATGSAGFLIAAMDLMIESATKNAASRQDLRTKIASIKESQLLGIEESVDIYALAATNMILRGDGSSKIIQNDSFEGALTNQIIDFKADKILLNPPFSYRENGMPFILRGLDNMPPHALGAIIIQDSAGSGKAKDTNLQILKNHTLKASIKMPVDLFVPMAGVQTSIYVFEAGVPHDFKKRVKFIDFRNDGFKRTIKALAEQDDPILRYADIVELYKYGKDARLLAKWDLDEVYVEDFINDSGCDWNFDQHKKIDTTPKIEDFKRTVADFLAWEVGQVLKSDSAKGPNDPF